MPFRLSAIKNNRESRYCRSGLIQKTTPNSQDAGRVTPTLTDLCHTARTRT